MMRYTLSLLFLILTLFIRAQTGCTDENASNYDPVATQNDGSCLYPATSYSPVQVANLPTSINESSGVIHLDNGLWTHNDSGNSPHLYLIDTVDFTVVRSVYIKNNGNVDWEAITHNENHVFIGDFGNNNGDRTDLRVLKLNRSLLMDNTVDTVEADVINFDYPDQVSFMASSEHNFDCEAFLYRYDSLHLFTKHRGNTYTKHYTLPALPGNYTANLRDSLVVEGQITGAHIQGDSLIGLIGYRPDAFYEPFLFLLWDFDGSNVFSGNKRSIGLGTVMDMGQNEALHFSNDFKGWITSEKNDQLGQDAAIYHFDIAHLFSTAAHVQKETSPQKEWRVYPNPTREGVLNIQYNASSIKKVEIFSQDGRVMKQKRVVGSDELYAVVHISDLSAGTYLLMVEFTNGKIAAERIVVR